MVLLETLHIITVREEELLDWVREFAQKNYHQIVPSREQVDSAIAAFFPERLLEYSPSASMQDLLKEIFGIVTIIRLGKQHIAWSIATKIKQAEAMQSRYSTSSYSQIRKLLGIDAHWILPLDPQPLFTLQDLYEAHLNLLESQEQPECAIVAV